MKHDEPILDEKVLQGLVHEIGLANTLKFMDSLDRELQNRIRHITTAIAAHSFSELAAQAHSLKSSAQISGARRLAGILTRLEVAAKQEQEGALALAQEALNAAELTRFAYLDVKLPGK